MTVEVVGKDGRQVLLLLRISLSRTEKGELGQQAALQNERWRMSYHMFRLPRALFGVLSRADPDVIEHNQSHANKVNSLSLEVRVISRRQPAEQHTLDPGHSLAQRHDARSLQTLLSLEKIKGPALIEQTNLIGVTFSKTPGYFDLKSFLRDSGSVRVLRSKAVSIFRLRIGSLCVRLTVPHKT